VWGVGAFQPQSIVILNGTQHASPTLLAVANEEPAMSIAKKAGLLVGVIGAAATVATAAEGGEGGHGGRVVYAPYYVVAPAVRYRPPPVVYVAPPPVVYAAPPPIVYQPVYDAPAYPSLNINIPLR
jgi:hypothetical protein